MQKEKASIISVFANIFLTVIKLIVGIISGSTALIADAIHSGLDVLSSLVSFLGINFSRKREDKTHPYGYASTESIAGFLVALLLAVSAIWIMWEGFGQIFYPQETHLDFWAYVVTIISILVNEVIARYKFKIGQKERSLALIADAKHSRADAISSLGVLLALFVIKILPLADGVIAVIIGAYILYESWEIGKETTDHLIGVSDPEVEEQIKKILKEQNIEFSNLKSRRIGSFSMAELTIKLDPELNVARAEKISKALQDLLIAQISNLSYVIIQVESHDYSQSLIKFDSGKGMRWQEEFRKKGYKVKEKKGYRLMIPIMVDKIANDFGAPEYFVIDKDKNGKTIQTQKIKNPFYHVGEGHGGKMIDLINPDEIISKNIGEGVKMRAQNKNIKINIISSEKELKDFYE